MLNFIPAETRSAIAALKREGRLEEAASSLKGMIEEQLNQGEHPEPWPFEQAAIVYRKLKDYAAEARVIEQFVERACFRRPSDLRLYSRLPKALKLASKNPQPRVSGDPRLLQPAGPTLDELFFAKAAILDTETTGLGPSDELIELALIRFRFDKRSGEIIDQIDEYHGLREPTCAISPRARAVHGISDEELRGARLDEERVSAMISECHLLIAHNAAFDRSFVSRLFPEAESRPWACTLNGIAWPTSSQKLGHLLQEYGVESQEQHRAVADARGLFNLLRVRDSRSETSFLSHLLAGGYQPPIREDEQSEDIHVTVVVRQVTTQESSARINWLYVLVTFLVLLLLLAVWGS